MSRATEKASLRHEIKVLDLNILEMRKQKKKMSGHKERMAQQRLINWKQTTRQEKLDQLNRLYEGKPRWGFTLAPALPNNFNY